MTAVDIAAICAAITTVFTGFAIGLRFLVKGWLNELRPNGGSSIKDQINRLEGRVDDLFVLLSRDN
jgi:tetrahydromethanopterin S-methyltransferase subunit B